VAEARQHLQQLRRGELVLTAALYEADVIALAQLVGELAERLSASRP